MFRHMPAYGLRLAVRLLLVALCVVTVALLAGASVALELAPAALLALALLLGRYPGERVIHRMSRRVAPPHSVRCIPLPRAPRSLGAHVAALAVPGAGRAPPVTALT